MCIRDRVIYLAVTPVRLSSVVLVSRWSGGMCELLSEEPFCATSGFLREVTETCEIGSEIGSAQACNKTPKFS